MSDNWSDQDIQMLKDLVGKGNTAGQIEKAFVDAKTTDQTIKLRSRGAVIGKCNRLGLQLKGRSAQSKSWSLRSAKPNTPATPMAAPAVAPAMTTTEVTATIDEPEASVTEKIVIPFSKRVTIMELKEDMCRWPMGDPCKDDFRYCGACCEARSAYCAFHGLIASR